ncbi:MAG TPA: hypothetical protein PKH94_08475 [Bacteroidales bacterium]|nr:hypothetical protein [Bacteroidales bacterium]
MPSTEPIFPTTSRSPLLLKIMLMLLLPFLITFGLLAQSHRHYTYSFSEESSLLGGAVIGGGSGTAAIFYNPASIKATGQSSFSLNASLVYIDWGSWNKALGDNYDLKQFTLAFRPRFVSYLIKSNLDENLTFQFVTFSKETFHRQLSLNDRRQTDILLSNPGYEEYVADFSLYSEFTNYWVGLGSSYEFNEHLSVGCSLFGIFKVLDYWNLYNLAAFGTESELVHPASETSSYLATMDYKYRVKFNDYRLMFSVGMQYRTERMDFGMKIEFPSLGVYEDGKQLYKSEKQQNIMNPDGSGFLPDYLIEDAQKKKQISVNYKDPWSLGAGLAYHAPDGRKSYYVSLEYFHRVKPYALTEVKDQSIVSTGLTDGELTSQQWLECAGGAKTVVNLALGAKWKATENALILAGFRTDFNDLKKFDYGDYGDLNQMITEVVDMYHFSFGTSLTILKNVVNTGITYSVGHIRNQMQLMNLSDPVEYNTIEQAALQGTRTSTMSIRSNQINLFLGLTLNWPGATKK